MSKFDLFLTKRKLGHIKKDLAKTAPEVKPSHRVEAIARALNHRSFAALSSSLANGYAKVTPDEPSLSSFLKERSASPSVETFKRSIFLNLVGIFQLQYEIERIGVEETDKNPITFKGVVIDSRFSDKAELDRVARLVASLEEADRDAIKYIWIDSLAGANYIVTVKPDQFSNEMGTRIGARIRDVLGGHNGVSFVGGSPEKSLSFKDLDPDWGETDDWE